MAIKIMYLIDHYQNPQAGTEGQLFQLVEHLDRTRYEPSMTVFRSSEYIDRNLFPCPVRVLNITKLASVGTISKILQYVRTLHRENYRLVHCYFNDTSLIAPVFLKFFGIKVLVSRRDMGFWYTPRNLLALRLVAPFVDRYIANSQAVKQIVQQQERVAGEKITVIYNGYAPTTSNDQEIAGEKISEIPDGVPIIGIVANLRPIKRMDVLIEAFAIIANAYPDAYLVIIGDKASSQANATFRQLENLISRLNIAKRVIFLGKIEKPMPYIRKFTIAILCSESEGFSNSIIEYMQAGRPIICTNTGGNAEIIQDGHNGLLIPVGDSSALANSLMRLLSDNTLAHRLGQVGYETVRAYTHTRMIVKQMACYDQVLATG